ncbi:MAG TPA: carboxylesterase family protein, partial [Variovorax sp.]|nr:carboxylesterase family protein [Variovorax sp.]
PFIGALIQGGAAAASAAPPAAAPSEEGLVRPTRYGAVRGSRDAAAGTLAWLGVPYAEPFVGDRRWKATVEPAAWRGVRDARTFGASRGQGARPFSPSPLTDTCDASVIDGPGQPVGSEDCLTLNIGKPGTPATALPVVVFVHGGSNVSGCTADPMRESASTCLGPRGGPAAPRHHPLGPRHIVGPQAVLEQVVEGPPVRAGGATCGRTRRSARS